MKSVRDRGTDVTDTGFDLRPGENLSDLAVELTSQRQEVSGLVSDAKGQRATDYTVVVFPQGRERWEGLSRAGRSHSHAQVFSGGVSMKTN